MNKNIIFIVLSLCCFLSGCDSEISIYSSVKDNGDLVVSAKNHSNETINESSIPGEIIPLDTKIIVDGIHPNKTILENKLGNTLTFGESKIRISPKENYVFELSNEELQSYLYHQFNEINKLNKNHYFSFLISLGGKHYESNKCHIFYPESEGFFLLGCDGKKEVKIKSLYSNRTSPHSIPRHATSKDANFPPPLKKPD